MARIEEEIEQLPEKKRVDKGKNRVVGDLGVGEWIKFTQTFLMTTFT